MFPKTQRHERYALGILAATLLLLSLRLPFKPSLLNLWLGHISLILAYLLLIVLFNRLPSTRILFGLRGMMTVMGVIGTLFITLGWVGFECVDWRGDPWLDRADRLICLGYSPSLCLDSLVSYRSLEFFSFVYGIFIPYMYFSVFLSAFGRPRPENEAFLSGFVLLYALGYLGYLLLPATGPLDYLAPQFQHLFQGGAQYARMMDSVRFTGLNHGAFPSLHVGASVYLCLFELRHNRLRGMAYLPIVLLIIFSTLFLRWHYLVDVIAGGLLGGLICQPAGRLQRRAAELDPRLQFLASGDREPRPLDWEPLAPPALPKKAADRRALEAFLLKLEQAGIGAGDLFLPLDFGKAAFFAARELEIAIVGLPLFALGYGNDYMRRIRLMVVRCRSFFRLWADSELREKLQEEGRRLIRKLS